MKNCSINMRNKKIHKFEISNQRTFVRNTDRIKQNFVLIMSTIKRLE